MYDVAVIGLGTWGASSLWQLAERGVTAVGLDQYEEAHQFGASHGYTRLFRVACMEHPRLGDVAHRAQTLWRELETHSSEPLLHQTGAVTVGKSDSDYIKGALSTARAQNLQAEVLDAGDLRERFPAFEGVQNEEIGVIDPSGGIVAAEATLKTSLQRARALGADVLTSTRVTSISRDPDALTIHTSAGRTIRTKRIAVTVGPWLAKLAQLEGFEARRTSMSWFSPSVRSAQKLQAPWLPGFIRRFDDFSIWGHGDVGGHGVKVGLSQNANAHQPTDPRHMTRDVFPSQDWKQLGEAISRTFPTLDPVPRAIRPCMSTVTPDHQFIIGRLDGEPRVVVAGGCAGHGFKHSSAVGEYVAELINDEETTVSPGIWDPQRFQHMNDRLLQNLFTTKDF